MKTKLKKLSYWAGVSVAGIVLGLSLQFTRAWVEPTVAPPGGSIGAPVNTGDVTQKKTGNIGFGIDVPVPGIAVMGQGSLSGGWFVGDPAGSGNALTLGTYGTGKALSAYEGTSFFEDAVGIGEGTTTISAGLLLDVHGKVGASEYCDQNGANCKAATSLGGGGLYQNDCSSGSQIVCCSVRVSSGAVDCKQTNGASWLTLASPWLAASPSSGNYHITMTAGSYHRVCRTDGMTRSTQCKEFTGAAWTVIGSGNPW